MEKMGYTLLEAKTVVLFGASDVSASIAHGLAQEWNVVIVDDHIQNIKKIAPFCPQVLFLHGNPLDEEVLEKAGLMQASYALGVTENDTLNLLSALMARSYGVAHCLAVVRYPSLHHDLISLCTLGIERIVHPAQRIASMIVQKLTKTTFYPMEGRGAGSILEVVIKKTAKVCQMASLDIESETLKIVAVIRKKKTLWAVDRLCENDRAIVTLLPQGQSRFQKLFSH